MSAPGKGRARWSLAYERLPFAYERLPFAYERLPFAYERLPLTDADMYNAADSCSGDRAVTMTSDTQGA